MKTKPDAVIRRLCLACALAGLPCDAWLTMTIGEFHAAIRRRALS